jgi:hypothetical protein
MNVRRHVAGFALFSGLLVLSACKRDDAEKGSSAAAASAALTKLPGEFPSSVPLYPGAALVSNTLDKGINGKPQRKVELTTKDPIDKVRAHYAPSKLAGLKHTGGDGSPGHALLLNDPQRFIDVRITLYPAADLTHIELVASLM